jgi:hypothetical protein
MNSRISSVFRGAALLAALAASLAAQQDRVAGPVDRSHVRELTGNTHPIGRSLVDVGAVDPALRLNRVTLMFQRSSTQQTALDRLLRDQQDLSSPNYHKWLTPEQFANQFGLSPNDIATISSWLRSEGLVVGGVARSRNSIWFNGTAAQIQTALHTSLRRYQVGRELHFANAIAPSVPTAIVPAIAGVLGLDDFHPKPHVAQARPLYTSAGGAESLAPGDFATIYDVDSLYSHGYAGAGQTIVVAGQSDIALTDVQLFRSTYGLPANDPQLILVPGSGDPGMNSAEIEGDLDVEWAGAVAPQASILYVYSEDAFVSAAYAIESNLAPILTFGFGICEADQSTLQMMAMQDLAQEANAQGITWLASAGDAGPAGCDPDGDPAILAASQGLAVQLPGSIPEVTAVGGTQFNEGTGTYWSATNSANASALSYIPEIAWNESGANGLDASGGGLSTFFTQPWWQTAFGVPSPSFRAVPDVALAAETREGHRIVSEGQTLIVGGTSAASPAFAGILALVNQYQLANGVGTQSGQGNINPNLYSLAQTSANVFHDITAGNNIIPCASGTPDCSASGKFGYNAGPGYDLVTGLGSVDAYNLAIALTAQWSTPAISSLNPSSAVAGGASFTLFVYGSGFDAGTVVKWMGTTLPTTFISPTEVQATVGSPQYNAAVNASVSVLTAHGPSAAVTFVVKGGLNAQLALMVVSAMPPPPDGCAVPPVAATISTTDTVYLYFEATVTTNDQLSFDWVTPNGTIVGLGVYPPVAGDYCFPGNSLDLNGADLPNEVGIWQSRIFNHGSLLFSVPFRVTQAVSDPFSDVGQVVPASGGSQFIHVTFPAGYGWTASSNAYWLTFPSGASGTGSGTLNYSVLQNVGAAQSATITIGNYSFTVQQQAASIPLLTFMGSMAHIAAEENWTTSFTLVNKGATPATARLSLFGDPSGALNLPLAFPQQPPSLPLLAASFDNAVAANASLIVTTAGPQTPPVEVGSAQLAATGSVDGFAIFHLIPGAQEAVVPMETRNASSYILAFDNTSGVVLGVAIANVSSQSGNVGVILRDDTGVQIGTGSIAMQPNGHKSFVLSDLNLGFPVTANIRGTVEFDTPPGGQISVLGIRTTPLGTSNTLTTIPALANVGTTGGSIAHIATGNGWQTTFVLVNTGTTTASVNLNFFADVTGAPLPLPISFPQVSGTVTIASSVSQMLAAGATLLVLTDARASNPAPTIGSAQLTTSGNVSGFVIFRYNPNGQEAVVPLESRTASGFILAFDNTAGTATGIAVNSVSAQSVNVPVIVRDDTGNQLTTDTLSLNANGHLAFTLGSSQTGYKYPQTANIRGTIELDTPAGGQIGALGIRIPVAHTFTTLPALAK